MRPRFAQFAERAPMLVLGLLATCPVSADEPEGFPTCSMRLSVEVTPDVPSPGDSGFISSLLGNHTGYRLSLVSVVDDTHVDLRLQGPGPDERCQEVVNSMTNDGRVLSIDAT
jgi:hypothetical protein